MADVLPSDLPCRSLYVHVPFCAQKCGYCAFYSEVSNGALMERYVSALLLELDRVADRLRPQTLFFGGGTPSILNLRQWETVLAGLARRELLGAAEWTVECNPATVSPDKARLLRDHGVNRISMGVQSLDDALLERLGRVHSREMVFRSYDILRQAGFDNINLDLMFAIPGQTLEIWRTTLAEVLALDSEHLSSYEVIYEEDTPLFEQLRAGKVAANEDLACAMYEELVEQAEGAGFRQYEIANFARGRRSDPGVPGSKLNVQRSTGEGEGGGVQQPDSLSLHASIPAFACRHNVNYWRGGSFFGLGPGATTYVGGVRTKNRANTQLYCEQLERGRRPVESREALPPVARAGETAAFGLRLVTGWPFEEFLRVTGHDLRGEWSDDMHELERRGWGRITPEGFHLTRAGLRFADAAGEMFLR
jgi:oxygen-independent coproporphyrinogen III oxidase